MAWGPAVLCGMVRVLIKTPLVRVAASPVFGEIVVVSYLKIMAVLAGKLVPLIVTSVPAGPEVGKSVSMVAAAVTVN